jgi:hypothetical protein
VRLQLHLPLRISGLLEQHGWQQLPQQQQGLVLAGLPQEQMCARLGALQTVSGNLLMLHCISFATRL